MVFFSFLGRMLREQKLKFISVIVMMVLVALMEAATVALLIPLMNLVIGQSGGLTGALSNASDAVKSILSFLHIELSLPVVLVMVILAFIIQSGIRMLMMHLQTRILTNYEFSLIHKLFGGYFSSSWGFFVRNRAGDLVNTLTIETERATGAYRNTLEFLSSFLIMVFYIVLSIVLSWQITLAGIILSLAAMLILRNFIQRSHRYGVSTSETNSEIQSYAYDKISAAKLLKSSATEKQALEYMDDITQRRVGLKYRSQMNSAFVQSLYFPLAIAALSLVVYISLIYLKLSPAVILVFSYIFFRLSPYFNSLQSSYQQALYNLPAVGVIDKTLENINNMAEAQVGKEIKEFNREINFDNVSFAYQEGARILNNVNLTIKKGESIAIIGESGEGKTTVIDLLLGLFTPTEGQITVDGTPLTEYAPGSWRKLIGHMSQDIFLFHDTIEANLKWMAPGAAQEKIEAAARAAYAHDFIVDTPKGYKTIVGDRGVKLSGGQRQRLALARMILQDPEIIILDEATSALDVESEARVQESIEKLMVNKTLIVISHRVSMLRNISKVYQLKNGNITEINKPSVSN